jgi:hypothetical protein
MSQNKTGADFVVRVAARFLKDPAISSDAKALRAVLGAYADGHTGASYVLPSTLEQILGWSRYRRERAQREGVRYPAILLRRKKELERGTWSPRAEFAAPTGSPGDPDCAICHGVGTIANPGGLSGRLCECFIRKHSQKRIPPVEGN